MIKVTQKRLNKLNTDKMSDIANLGFKNKYNNEPFNHKPAKLDKLDKSNTVDLRALFKDMENLYSIYSDKVTSKIPIYNIGGLEKARNNSFPWFKPMCTMCNLMIEYPKKKAIKFQVKQIFK